MAATKNRASHAGAVAGGLVAHAAVVQQGRLGRALAAGAAAACARPHHHSVEAHDSTCSVQHAEYCAHERPRHHVTWVVLQGGGAGGEGSSTHRQEGCTESTSNCIPSAAQRRPEARCKDWGRTLKSVIRLMPTAQAHATSANSHVSPKLLPSSCITRARRPILAKLLVDWRGGLQEGRHVSSQQGQGTLNQATALQPC